MNKINLIAAFLFALNLGLSGVASEHPFVSTLDMGKRLHEAHALVRQHGHTKEACSHLGVHGISTGLELDETGSSFFYHLCAFRNEGEELNEGENDSYQESAFKLFSYLAEKNLQNFDLSNPETESLLHAAASSGNIQTVRWLLEKGATVDKLDRYGETPLIKAASFNRGIAVISVLVNAGARVKASDNQNATALHWVAYNGDTASATLLLKSRADPNAVTLDQRTPLRNAGEIQNQELRREMIELLRRHGAGQFAPVARMAPASAPGSSAIDFSEDDLDLIRDLASEYIRENQVAPEVIDWAVIVAKFCEVFPAQCFETDPKDLARQMKKIFGKTFLREGSTRKQEFNWLVKSKPAAKRDRQKDDDDEPYSAESDEGRNNAPREKRGNRSSGLSSRTVDVRAAKDDEPKKKAKTGIIILEPDDLDAVRDLALDEVKKSERVNWTTVATAFRDEHEALCEGITNLDLARILRIKFNNIFGKGKSRRQEWNDLKDKADEVRNNGAVTDSPSKKRAVKMWEHPVVIDLVSDETPTSQLEVQDEVDAPESEKSIKKSKVAVPEEDAAMVKLMRGSNDDKFMNIYDLAYKANRPCINCVMGGENTTIAMAALKMNRLELFKRLVKHPAFTQVLDVEKGGATLRSMLVNELLRGQHFALLPELIAGNSLSDQLVSAFENRLITKEVFVHSIGERNVDTVAYRRFLSLTQIENNDELIKFWFSSGLIDWSGEVELSRNNGDGHDEL